MKIDYQRQPPGSSLCGQTCVAMIAGVPLEESISRFNSKGGTRTKQVKQVLESFGFNATNRLKRVTKGTIIPSLAIGKMRWSNSNHSHWVVIYDGKIYDPDPITTPPIRKVRKQEFAGSPRITSYLEIKRAKPRRKRKTKNLSMATN